MSCLSTNLDNYRWSWCAYQCTWHHCSKAAKDTRWSPGYSKVPPILRHRCTPTPSQKNYKWMSDVDNVTAKQLLTSQPKITTKENELTNKRNHKQKELPTRDNSWKRCMSVVRWVWWGYQKHYGRLVSRKRDIIYLEVWCTRKSTDGEVFARHMPPVFQVTLSHNLHTLHIYNSEMLYWHRNCIILQERILYLSLTNTELQQAVFANSGL